MDAKDLLDIITLDDIDMLKKAISDGTNVNITGFNGNTALHIAAARGRPEIFHALLHAGAMQDSRNTSGYTPLHIAADKGHRSIVELSISNGGSTHARTVYGETPLHISAKRGTTDCMRALLLNASTDVNATDTKGKTPLHYATENSGIEMAHMLLSHGANPLAKDSRGATPIGIAHLQKDSSPNLYQLIAAAVLKRRDGTSMHSSAPPPRPGR